VKRVKSFGNLLDLELEIKNPLIVEKFPGIKAKSAALFFKKYHAGRYVALNLADCEEKFFLMAKELSKTWKFNFEEFKRWVDYRVGINLTVTRLEDIVKKPNIIVYWGPALEHYRVLDKEDEIKYFEIIRDEKEFALKNRYTQRDFFKRVRRRYLDEIHPKTTKEDFTNLFANDLSCLDVDGIIITNHARDPDIIEEVMNSLDMEGRDYIFKSPKKHIKEYERCIRVWKRRK
jgi:hypothetical protein